MSRSLQRILAVLTTAENLDPVEAAYTKTLGYGVLERGVVSETNAAAWGAPDAAGKRYLTLAPQAGEPTFLRFVEQAQPPGYKPMTSFGWSSTEIIVEDCDAVGAHLEGTAFRQIAEPRRLGPPTSKIRAMQAVGPANEMLYLTSVAGGATPYDDMPAAEAFVGRCFIAVIGSPDIAATRAFYGQTFGVASTDPWHVPIRSLSIQNDLPWDTKYDLVIAPLGAETKIEADSYPSVAKARPFTPGQLPAGMAMVSFACGDFDRHVPAMKAPPQVAAEGPFKGRRTGVLIGPADEWIELVEA